MSEHSNHGFEFGPHRLDVGERLLWRGDEVVPLTPKAFEMLLALLEHSGHVLTKEELMQRVWPDTIVEEANLSHNIYKLREALGDGRNGEKYIETVPRRGYRFVEKVTEVCDEDLEMFVAERMRASVIIEEETSDTPTSVITHHQAVLPRHPAGFERHRIGLVIVALGLVLSGGAAMLIWRGWWKRSPPGVERQAIPISGSATITQITNSGKSGGSTISPDGKLIAYVQNSYAGTGSMYVRQMV